MIASPQPSNPHLTYNASHLSQARQPTHLAIPPPPPQQEQPLVSATFIPGGDSFGPGVGIPPLEESSYSRYDTHAGLESKSIGAHYYDAYNDGSSYQYSASNQSLSDASSKNASSPTPINKPQNLTLPLRDPPEPISPGPPTAVRQNTVPPTGISKSGSGGGRSRAGSSSVPSPSQEYAAQWPLEKVLQWLAANGFSQDWQETFKQLSLQGSDFLELGRSANGRGNAKMHQVVYPQLAKVCSKNKTGRDQAKEREEGKRMRKLIRRLVEEPGSAGLGHRRRESGILASASTEGGVENSPSLGRHEFTGLEGSPSKQLPAQFSGTSGSKNSQPRSTTLPLYSKHSSQGSTPSEPSHVDSLSSHNPRSVLNNLGPKGRQSPCASLDGVSHSPNGSPALGHVAPLVTSYPHGRPEHSKSNSVDSVSRPSEPSTAGRFYEGQSRRNAHETSRLSPLEGGRPSSNENAPTNREHAKGFLSKFMNRKKHDGNQPSEDQQLDSPTSPVSLRLQHIKPGVNGSDALLVPRPASASAAMEEEKPVRGKLVGRASPARRFIFVTRDYWNYRLIDVTDVDSAEGLRKLICLELDIADVESAQIFVTQPGQSEHDEPLGNSNLLAARRTRSDYLGTLKFFVRSPDSSASSVAPPGSAGLGVSMAQKSQLPPCTKNKKTFDEEAYGQYVTRAQNESATYLGSRESAFRARSGSAEEAQGDRGALIHRTAEEFKRETERKAKAYQESRQQKNDQATGYTGAGISSNRMIDFDAPRLSPYEDKKPDVLVPLRKPPAAPSESSTLTKVNSLSKKTGDRIRTSGHFDALKRLSDPIVEEPHDRSRRRAIGPTPSVTEGIGAALASVGKIAGAAATVASTTNECQPPLQRVMISVGSSGGRSYSQGGSPRPDFTWGKGNLLFNVPDYGEGAGEVSKMDEQSSNGTRDPVEQAALSPPTSPTTGRPILQSRKSYGPNFDFEENRIDFNPSPRPPDDDSDDDSDDGLFAIPIMNNSVNATSVAAIDSKAIKPSLSVDTESKPRHTRSVSFKSPTATSGSARSVRTPPGDDTESLGDRTAFDPSRSDSASYLSVGLSPDDRLGRRGSFASEIWANRPPVENVVDHLDEFFPGVDLDLPYLEERGDGGTSPMAGSSQNPLGGFPSALQGQITDGLRLALAENDSDTLGSDESTLKAKDRDTVSSVASVGQTQAKKSGGLGRMKSIREVARGRNDLSGQISTTARVQQDKATGLARRKSTKMFGAHIVQIKPRSGPGDRLSTLDPIPQEEVPRDDTPRRQATFKIICGQLIGKGTYGRVYLGMNATTGEFLAVKQVEVNQKVAQQDKESIKAMVAALDTEIETMQHLEHPNIVQYLGCERKEYSISIYLEYISGGSIGSCLRKHGKFEESVVRSLTRQTLEGLAYLHQEGILHRDLKADNILLDLDGTGKISDFGISKKSDNIYGNDITNSMQGSVFWMAPEVVRAQGQGYSAKVDIWSLGCVVLEMFAGRRPWSREEAVGAIFKLGSLNQAPPIPDDVSTTASVDGLNFMYDCFQM